MANYEMMIILDTSVSEKDRDSSISELKELFKKNSIKIKKEDIWWDKKLAYKINKNDRGFYIVFDLDMDWTIINNISKAINLNTFIWRYMFTKK